MASKARENLKKALTLGTRVSVHSAWVAYWNLAESDTTITSSRKARAESWATKKDLLHAEVMALAARDLNVSVADAQEDWQIDQSIEAQLREKYPAAVLHAYRVGRRLGYSDERVTIPVYLTETGREFGVAAGLGDSSAFDRTAADVSLSLRELGYPLRIKWRSDGLWMRLAQARGVLKAITRWLVEPSHEPQSGELTTPIDSTWIFGVLLSRESGAPSGYDLVVGPEVVTMENSATFDSSFRRIAWLPRLPRAARVPRTELEREERRARRGFPP